MNKYVFVIIVLLCAFLSACTSTSFSVEIEEPEKVTDKNPDNRPGEVNLDKVTDSDVGFGFIAGIDGSDTFYKNESVDVSRFSRIDAVYEGYQDLTLKTVVILATVQGRWGEIEFAFAVNKEDDIITSFDVLRHSEKWGAFIDGDSFKNQFVGTALTYYELNLFGIGVDGDANATTTFNSMYAGLSQIITMYYSNFQ